MMSCHVDMTKNQFNQALRQLGLSAYASPVVLKVTLRQARRYASGEQQVEARVAAILEMLASLSAGELHRLRDWMPFYRRTRCARAKVAIVV
jgi:hypothetical protein